MGTDFEVFWSNRRSVPVERLTDVGRRLIDGGMPALPETVFERPRRAQAMREAAAPLSTESLLMEGARRIDEWSRIADRVPNLSVIPDLAPTDADHPALLDLLPQEWRVLSSIDGQTDLRTIAATVSMSEFDVAIGRQSAIGE